MESVQNLGKAPQFREQVEKLIEDYFPKGHQQGICQVSKEFSALLNTSNSQNILFVTQNAQVVATLSWKSFEIQNGLQSLKVAALGLVVTHPNHRAQGLSSLLMKTAEQAALQENCALMFLWSDLIEHYQARGYLLLGGELQYSIEASKFNDSTNSNPLLKKFDPTRAHTIYQSMKIGPLRTQQSYLDFLSLPATQSIQTTHAYLLAGKARDLHNVIHEIAGDPKDYETLIREWIKKTPVPSQLQIPASHPHHQELTKLLGSPENVPWVFAKILNTQDFIRALNLTLNEMDLNISYHPTHWSLIRLQKGLSRSPEPPLFESRDEGHLLQIFWSPWDISQIEELNPKLQTALQKWKAPSLYFWGLDSV